jgi:hypothetical protein
LSGLLYPGTGDALIDLTRHEEQQVDRGPQRSQDGSFVACV